MYPFGLKGCKKISFLVNAPFGHFSLAIYPSDIFFLKALFLRGLRRDAACNKDLILVPFRLIFALGIYFYLVTYLLAVLVGFGLARWALRTWPQFPKIRAGFFLQFSLQVSL